MALSCECAEQVRLALCDNSLWSDDTEGLIEISGDQFPQNWKVRQGRLHEITNNGAYGQFEDGTDISLDNFCHCTYVDDNELEFPDGDGTDGVPKVQVIVNKCLEPGDEYILVHGDEENEEERAIVAPGQTDAICTCCCFKELNHELHEDEEEETTEE